MLTDPVESKGRTASNDAPQRKGTTTKALAGPPSQGRILPDMRGLSNANWSHLERPITMTQSLSEFMIRGRKVRVDVNGLVSLKDLHKASGYSTNKTPTQWRRLDITKRLTMALLEKTKTARLSNGNFHPRARGRSGPLGHPRAASALPSARAGTIASRTGGREPRGARRRELAEADAMARPCARKPHGAPSRGLDDAKVRRVGKRGDHGLLAGAARSKGGAPGA